MALTADLQHDFDVQDQSKYENYNTAASTLIYEGALVTINASNLALPLVTTDVFAGVAVRQHDNSAGAADTEKRTRVLTEATLRNAAVAGAAATTQPGTAVYASDDGTMTLSSTGNLQVGTVVNGLGTNLADVYIQGAGRRSA